MEEDNISTIRSNRGGLRLTEYISFPRRCSPGKHVIQTSKIGSLLSTIRKQDHKTRSLGGPGTYQAGSSYRRL
jgi:hypothetical protein